MKTILVIAWFYPPLCSSEGIVTYKLLQNSRYRYEVFTQKQTDSWTFGHGMALPSREGIHCIYAESRTPEAWAEEAFRYFCQNRDRFDIVMTRSMPPQSHAVGLRIKRAFPSVRWIASFGDPLSDNPYELLNGSSLSPYALSHPQNRDRRGDAAFLFSPSRLLHDLLWRLRHREGVRHFRSLRKLEKQTLVLADRLVFNNSSQQHLMLAKRPAGKNAHIIPHSYDPSLYPDLREHKTDGKIRFVFLGQLNETRTALPLLRAIRRLRDDVSDLETRAEFHFFGQMPDRDLAYIMRKELQSIVRYSPPVPYLDSLREAQRADWLIHIDAELSRVCRENPFFPGKVADYLGAGRPILAVGTANGALRDCLHRAGHLTLSFSANEIKEALYLILYADLHPEVNEELLRSFTAKAVAARFDEKVVQTLDEA